MSVESLFLNASAARLRQSAGRIGVCLGKLTADQIWLREHETENAIGNLVLHLTGNVRQWVLSGLGGEPDIRVREHEFATRSGISGSELQTTINAVVDAASAIIESLTSEQLTRGYEIQTRRVTGVETVLGVVGHFAEHTGQIIFATKSFTGEDLKLMTPPVTK